MVSLLSLLEGSLSLLVTDKEEDFSKSITQNKEAKSILAHLWEADLHELVFAFSGSNKVEENA